MKKIKPASARALAWLAAVLAVIGCLVISPSAALLCMTTAALTAFIPAVFGTGRVRILAAILLLVSAGLAVAKYPEFRHEQAVYRKNVDLHFRQQLPPK